MISNKPIISLRNLEKKYSNKTVIDGINLDIYKGDYIAFLGESGCGKTTFLNIIGLLDNKYNGEYYFNGKLLAKKNVTDVRKNYFGFIFQLYYLISSLSIKDNILLPFLYISDYDVENNNNLYFELINNLHINKFIDQNISTLSGGEKQRVSIARALIHNPEIIICDEPTGNLDSYNTNIVMDVLSEENKKGKTILIVTHDLHVASYAKKVYQINNGILYEKND